MNRLSPYKRYDIASLLEEGATIREAASTVGCDRSTVGRLTIHAFRLRLLDLFTDALNEMEGCFDADHPFDLSPSLSKLWSALCSCPIHPEINEAVIFDHNFHCPECHAAGMRRHHLRRHKQP